MRLTSAGLLAQCLVDASEADLGCLLAQCLVDASEADLGCLLAQCLVDASEADLGRLLAQCLVDASEADLGRLLARRPRDVAQVQLCCQRHLDEKRDNDDALQFVRLLRGSTAQSDNHPVAGKRRRPTP